jgi:plasmid maintenance system antidote protein VapI
LESSSQKNKSEIGFIFLQQCLLSEVLRRINNGEITERGLARVIGVSQPQMHHVLKGKRRLQVELADRLLEKFGIDLQTLLDDGRARLLHVDLKAQGTILEVTPGRKGPGREQRIPSRLHRDTAS